MRKTISILLAAIMMLTLTAALGMTAASAEGGDEATEQAAPNPDLYSGTWVCDRATIEIVWEEEGYRVLIQWGGSAWDLAQWEYSCYYHEDDHTLVSMPFGLRTDLVYGDDGELVSATEIYNDGEAMFSLDEDGYLIWLDMKENAGEGMRFELLPASEPEPDAEG